MICSVTMCNSAIMAETLDLDTSFGRLRWAREQAGFASAADFARAVRVDPTTYRAHENGQNGYAKYAPDYAARLGVSSDWLMRGGPQPIIPLSAVPTIKSEVAPADLDVRQLRAASRDLPGVPVLGSAIGVRSFDPEQHVELTELDLAEVLDYIPRPASLANDKKAYAVTTVGDSMWPRFRPGRRLLVSPRAPVSIGDDVIVQLRGGADGEGDFRDRVTTVLIKELVRRTATYYELRQFNPDITFKVPIEQIAAMHKVIGEVPQ